MSNLPKTKAEVIALIEESWHVLLKTIEPLSDAQLLTPGPEGWSVKDHLAHLAVWAKGIAALLRNEARWEAMGLDAETPETRHIDEVNAILQMRWQAQPLLTVILALADAHQSVLAVLATLDDASLFRTYGYYSLQESREVADQPVLYRLLGNTAEHYAEHVPWIQAIVASLS